MLSAAQMRRLAEALTRAADAIDESGLPSWQDLRAAKEVKWRAEREAKAAQAKPEVVMVGEERFEIDDDGLRIGVD